MRSVLSQLPKKLWPAALDVIRTDPLVQQRLAFARGSWGSFEPREDCPEEFDQQASFCYDRCPGPAFLIGGNAAGTTEAAAFKAAQFLLYHQPPPRRDTPFWIASNTYDQVCEVCWKEKLLGHGHIPVSEVEWRRVAWHSKKLDRPSAVPLLPWPGRNPNHNWLLKFISFEQGRTALQAASIGGFWFSEQFPLDRLTETIRGCREYWFPGSMFAEFTPIDPDLCTYVEGWLDDVPDGWGFYRANTEKNRPNLADGWFESFFAAVPDEMRETRMTGALATFEGVIFPSFLPAVHVCDDPADGKAIPPGVTHFRGLDWGASEEHPFACVWGYRDGQGDWTVYDEYWSPSQTKITLDHFQEIAERSESWGWPGHWSRHRSLGNIWVPHADGQYGQTFADPSRPAEINEFAERGIDIAAAANSVFPGIDCLRSLLKPHPASGRPRLRIHRRCKHLIEEMRKYRWRKGRKPTEGTFLNPAVAAPQPLKRDDDTVDALRYMIYSSERGRGSVPGSMSHREYAQRRRAVQLDRHRGRR